jgi:hypothetical protein
VGERRVRQEACEAAAADSTGPDVLVPIHA